MSEAPVPGFIREAQRRAAAATKPTEIAEAPSTRNMTKLVRAGWDFETRNGIRIWRKPDEKAAGGYLGWCQEDVAVGIQSRIDESRIDERRER